MPNFRLRMPAALFLCALGCLHAHGADAGVDSIRARYTKYEYEIAMRDGVRLFTSVYIPKNSATAEPILLLRTPYSIRPYGEDQYPATLGPSDLFAKEGYIFAYQDVRGRFHSEGEFEHVRPHKDVKSGPRDTDESTDTYDTIEWLVKNIPGNNGKVGMWGISYPGFYVSEGMMDAHPALMAVSPQAPVGDWFIGDDFHHNGALYLAHAFRWFSANDRSGNDRTGAAPQRGFDYPSPDGYTMFLEMGTLPNIDEKMLKGSVPFWNDFRNHPLYDEFWQARDVRRHLKGVRPAVLTVGGWFDAEDLFGTLSTFRAVESGGPGSFNGLVMGPWFHGGWSRGDGASLGAVDFHSKTAEYYREQIEFPFFQHFLKGKSEGLPPKAWVFETGANQWRKFEAWPPVAVKQETLYFRAEGALKLGGAPEETAPAFDEYVSDPAHPVPYIGYIANTMTREHMLDDQRFAATRPDVLVYQTGVLDSDLTLAGPLTASLHVSTTGTDSDWVVKLIDVYPDDYPDPDPNPAHIHMGGYQQLVRGEPFRGKFRKSFEHPEPFAPGKMDTVEYTMPDVFHTFRRGHRVMVQVQSSWFPLVDRNPQVFEDIYNAKRTDFRKATQRVYRYRDEASGLRVTVLP
ncbi:MAG TPA: CocE/NonD family hydrolase [Bryobacteraceae bacterium]|nr:CocE/NonD family hydrolase [Bryobacteraceae bacterium]